MTLSSPEAEFVSRLIIEREALKAFVVLLGKEQQSLIDGRTEQLLELSEGKTQAVHELAKMANSRKHGLEAHGEEIKTCGIVPWLKSYAADSVSVWQDIEQLAEQMQSINHLNGTLIQNRIRNTQQALTVLHNAANSAQALYGADGQPYHPTSGRFLGSV
jgi:flagella synthesis protein FlgN